MATAKRESQPDADGYSVWRFEDGDQALVAYLTDAEVQALEVEFAATARDDQRAWFKTIALKPVPAPDADIDPGPPDPPGRRVIMQLTEDESVRYLTHFTTTAPTPAEVRAWVDKGMPDG